MEIGRLLFGKLQRPSRTNDQPTTQQTRPITIPPGGGNKCTRIIYLFDAGAAVPCTGCCAFLYGLCKHITTYRNYIRECNMITKILPV